MKEDVRLLSRAIQPPNLELLNQALINLRNAGNRLFLFLFIVVLLFLVYLLYNRWFRFKRQHHLLRNTFRCPSFGH